MIDELVIKIMDIEKRANLMVDNEKLKMAGIADEVEHLYLDKKKELEEKKKNRLDLLSDQEKDDEEKKITIFNDEFSRSVDNINKIMKNNKEKWMEEIYKRIIS